MIRSVLTAAVLVSALFAGQSAQAETAKHNQREVASLHIQVSESDLSNPAKARSIYNRLTAAAYQVCHSDISDADIAAADSACEAKAVSDAIRQLNQPALSLLNTQGSDKDARTAVARND